MCKTRANRSTWWAETAVLAKGPGGERAPRLLDEMSTEAGQRQRNSCAQLGGRLLKVTDPIKLCSQARTEGPCPCKSATGPHLWEGSCKLRGSEQAHCLGKKEEKERKKAGWGGAVAISQLRKPGFEQQSWGKNPRDPPISHSRVPGRISGPGAADSSPALPNLVQTGLQSGGDPSVLALSGEFASAPGSASAKRHLSLDSSHQLAPSGPSSAIKSDSTTVQGMGATFVPEWWEKGGPTAAAGETTAGTEPTISFTRQVRRLVPEKSRTGPGLMMELRAEPRSLAGQPRAQCNKLTRSGLCFVAATFLKCHLLCNKWPEIKPNRLIT